MPELILKPRAALWPIAARPGAAEAAADPAAAALAPALKSARATTERGLFAVRAIGIAGLLALVAAVFAGRRA